MVSQPIWIGIVIGVFFVGIGVSYAHFANTYDPMSMKFQNQELFDQMMSNNPRMSQQWMDSDMMNQDMGDSGMMMGSNPIEQHERMLELVEMMGDDENMMNHLFAHMIENERIVHQMFSLMDSSSALKEHMAAHVSGDLSEYEHLDDMHDDEEHGHEDEHQ